MQTLRTSASDLDAFRYYLANDDADLADLIAQLRRETPPTPAMLAGTALHKALELSTPGTYGQLSADGYTFTFASDAEIDLPEIREIKASRDYEIDGCCVTLVGKVDALHGRRIDDHKFTSRYDAERFLSSLQWRVYCDIFNADVFVWNVFEGRPASDDPKGYVINAVHTLAMHRYPGMRDDIERALKRYVDFARVHLPEKVIAVAPVKAPPRDVRDMNVLAAG